LTKRGIDVFSLRDKTVLVTGATGHLGKAMSRALGEAGAHVLVNSRSTMRGQEVAKWLLENGCSAEAAIFDVADQAAVNGYFANHQSEPIDVLINNAYLGGSGSIESTASDAYMGSYEVTVLAAHHLVKTALPCLRLAVKKNGGASVINLTSMYAMVSPDQRIYDTPNAANPPFYGAAKAALLQWTRYAACEFGAEGIRCNSISPGPFPSDSVQKSNPEFIQKLANKVPMARIGHPDEVAGPILFLASPASSFVNGANIVVDGGWTCW
jgi:NAD(P)-dependent dehydrogenase (short-subunit alcohol dehydrogenase family)